MRIRARKLLFRLAETLGPALLRLLGSTWRVSILPEGVEDRRREKREYVIFSFWHGRMLIPAFTHRFRNIGILISRHGDGEYIARVVERLGFRTVRGSTTRGGVAALKETLRLSTTGRDLAFTPDGPKGPRYRVQRGVVYAASRTGLPIVPAAVEAHPAWVMGSWDEFTIPKPFARTIILEGDPIHVPPDIEGDDLERERLRVEERMHEVMAEARRIARQRPRLL